MNHIINSITFRLFMDSTDIYRHAILMQLTTQMMQLACSALQLDYVNWKKKKNIQ